MPSVLARARVVATLLVALQTAAGQNFSAAGPPWNHADYLTSPPVFPTPNATGFGWEDAFEQASAFVAQLTLEEKVQLATGVFGPCIGNIAPIPRLGFNGLCLQDGPFGVRTGDFASVFPAGITVGAAWDKQLARIEGHAIGEEFVGKGAHVALGPTAGPIGRSAYGGRNFEGFSPDPFLSGELFGETIIGMESAGIQAVAKHLVGNEQETHRHATVTSTNISIESISSNIDDRTMHELYLWPFANAVKAGVSSVMCSYNRLNGSHACQNSKLQNGILKGELGFEGYIMSDWDAVHSGVATAVGGLDQNMPGGIGFVNEVPSYFGPNLTLAVNNGSVPVARLDDMVRRILTPYFKHGQNEPSYPGIDPSTGGLNDVLPQNFTYNFTYNTESSVDVRGDHAAIIRELGAAGIVLLKNVNNSLPLKAPKNIGVFGNAAGDLTMGQYSLFGSGAFGYEYGTLPGGGGSSSGRYTYVVPPLDAIKRRAAQDGAFVQYVLNNTAITSNGNLRPMYPPPEVCLVFLKTYSREGPDRTSLLVDWNGTAVATTVADNCANTIVITNSAGINVLPFADHPNITAILAGHLPGQEIGNSLVDVLYGDVNPSGHLPYTIAHDEADYQFTAITNSTALQNTNDSNAWQSDFTERLLIDYRHFDYYNLSVAFEFGFGLSYTTFAMGNVSTASCGDGSVTAAPPANKVQPGGNPALWEVLYTVTATVTNTGSVAGHAVPQLYLGLPQPANQDVTPVKVLRGFERVWLEAGESQEVEFPLMRRDISHWDIFSQDWIIADGDITVYAGFSSRDISSTSTFSPLA